MTGRRGRRWLAGVLAALVIAGGAWSWHYRGLMRAGLNYARYASIHESLNTAWMLRYWTDFVGRMRPDAAHFYTFDEVTGATPFDQALVAYHRGQFETAVSGIQADIAANGETETKLFWLALSQLRWGEQVNCLPNARHAFHADPDHAQYCALPIRKFHEDPHYSRDAQASFLRLIEHYAPDNRLYQWLLNYACMTTNDFPDRVPEKYRVQASFFDRFYGAGKDATEREFADLQFEERAGEFGIATDNAGRGVAVEDFDGDGYLDIVTGGSFDDLRLYRNRGGDGFDDRTAESGLGGVRQPFFITTADVDNDGHPDLLVSRMFHDGLLLFHNTGDGRFEEQTTAWGLPLSRGDNALSSSWAGAWADVNNDGRLDLFVSRMGMELPFMQGLLTRPRFYSALYINEGGHFVDRTEEYGLGEVVHGAYFVGAAFGDYDGDGFPDLYISSPVIGSSLLLHNEGGRRFTRSGAYTRTEGGFVGAFLDVNHDGRLDLFQGGFSDARSSIEMAMYGADPDAYHSGKSGVLIQQTDGRFVEQKGFFDMPGGTMGASFGDVNNDGCADFYLGTGSPEGWFIFPKLMFLGVPSGTGCALSTANVSATNNFATLQKGHGIVFFDFNGDGLQDIYSSLGGMWPADRWPNQFFVNRSRTSNHWVDIRLQGVRSNRAGAGAVVRVRAHTAQGEPVVRYALMDQKTAFGSGPWLVHVGLASAVAIDRVEVRWPGQLRWDGYDAGLDRLNTLVELPR